MTRIKFRTLFQCHALKYAHYKYRGRIATRSVTTWSHLASAFNSLPNKKFSILEEKMGLFGYRELNDPLGFELMKENAILEARSLVNEALSPDRKQKIVEIFDMLSDTLCKVADLAEFVRIGHPKKRFVYAAENAAISIGSLVEELNTNRKLYEVVRDVSENGDIFPTDPIDDHVAKLFLFDFEQSGIHLESDKRKLVVDLNSYILHVGSHFMNGSLKPRSVLKSELPENIRHCFSADGDSILVNGLFADSPNEIVREAAYKIFLFPDEHQEKLLEELLNARYQLAQLCGFDTYAHRAINGSLAGNPSVVNRFLQTISDELKSRANIDYNEMLKMKKTINKYAEEIKPWDIPYYTSLAKQQRFQIKGSDFSPYFSLGVCMDGINYLLQSLYDISLKVENVKNGEVWHTDVIKLSVWEGDGTLLGYIYCDFFERKDKPNQDCHFTIQGGRLLKDGSYQIPVVVLMLNFSSPTWSKPSLLTPNMIDNLFHEMGHAMHSMLARTKYQHVTGTRCSADIAEVPSILMEYFASDPRVVSKFARHYETGKPIPESLLKNLSLSKNLFSASEAQLQVFYAALDQKYHNKPESGKSTTEILKEVQQSYYGLPHVAHTAWQLRFGHLVGYGAKYYAYTMSRAIAAQIWHSIFKDDPLNRAAGERYRREVLAHGGSKPPMQLIGDFLQTVVTPEMLAKAFIMDIDAKT
ncbi:mitochondrial intermediate peptidase-like [Centruroides sculpturatus]|uniref:mitochondrial intermediate peptidase-like n=1 Tax=Centruroides sculpturatus TaxID=218467 RepID=UPI000C6CFA6D|nr:mitochondrial intermediate peptidase-like [Centruroides sculpturatus]